MRKIPSQILQILILICISTSISAQGGETHRSDDGWFAIDYMPEYPFFDNFDPTNEHHQMLIDAYPFEIGVDPAIMDETSRMLFSTHDSDEIETGQIIISVITNENWKPFDTVDEMLEYWYEPDTAEQFRHIDFHGWEGAELEISKIDRTGIYTIVMLDDGMYALTLVVTPKPQISVDGLQGIADEFNANIRVVQPPIEPLDDLYEIRIDDSIDLDSPLLSPDERYSFQPPEEWTVSVNPDNTVTLTTHEITDSDLPEFTIDVEVQALSPYIRQPETYIAEKTEMLTMSVADDFAYPFVVNLNGRRAATFDDYAEINGFMLILLLDDNNILIMDGIANNADVDKLEDIVFAVADSVRIINESE